MKRHPAPRRLAAGDERALRHAETCDHCADLLLGGDGAVGDGAVGDGAEAGIGALLASALQPATGFVDRTVVGANERIRVQDLWDLLGDATGGVADAVTILSDRGGRGPQTHPGDRGLDGPTPGGAQPPRPEDT